MSTEYSFPLGMLFRKMYCSRCGERLQRKQIAKVYKRGEPGFRNTTSFGRFINFSSYTKVTYIYCCPACGNELTYYKQLRIARAQKRQNKILIETDQDNNPVFHI